MCPVGNGSKNAREAESKPSEHNSDGRLVHLHPVSRIEFSFHPDIAKETVNYPGHSAKVRSGNESLGQVREDCEQYQKADEKPCPSARLNHASQTV